MRLMLVCASAAKLPMIMVSSAETQTSGSQRLLIGSNAVMKTRRKMAKAAALGPADRNARHRRGRALVDVRRPDLERRGGDLEGEADEHQRGGHADQRAGGGSPSAARAEPCGYRVRLVDAGDAVDPGDAVEQERGGERAQQEVLERRFVGALVVAQVAGQHVAGDRGDLQADEDHDQLVGRRHHALAGDREQQQRVVLAGLRVLAPEILRRTQSTVRMPTAITSTRKKVAKPSTISMSRKAGTRDS